MQDLYIKAKTAVRLRELANELTCKCASNTYKNND